MEDCSCLQMSDTSVWFVAPKAGDTSSRSVHCIEFAPSGRRINPHAASDMTDREDDEIDIQQ